MQLIRGLQNLHNFHHECVATIGNFDGLHIGHQAILLRLKESAALLNLPTCVIIFEPQPREFFNPETAPIRLTRLREKLELLQQAGIDYVLCLHFNKRLRQLSADDFVQQILVQGLHVKHLQIGDDFRFGCDRSGDFAFLQQQGECFGFTVEPTGTIELDGVRVSSTRVRDALAQSDFALAQRLLGRPYSITGRVLYGQQLGRTINAPTANVQLKRHKAPVCGVFLIKATLVNGKVIPGVANLGVRPSVKSDGKAHLEVHLLDFSGNLYGQPLHVEFLQKIRDEKRFASLAELQEAIAADIAYGRYHWQHFHTL
ncbi:bifunctional riboflavin kinase/FAD synthetase [Pseudomonas sp. F1_0610]|uniref:bifunctional riboflavin kinase/FAD synthetase n=1 Tax=Pseudomonas sp. F1_0610 TaxID=3114284 RepID=UPI0039C17C17